MNKAEPEAPGATTDFATASPPSDWEAVPVDYNKLPG